MSKINIEIIKQFKEIFQYAKDVDKKDLKLYFNKESLNNHNSFEWLYISLEQEIKLIGLKYGVVYAIDTNGYLIEVCNGLENIPYEILRIQSCYANNEEVQDLFNSNKEMYEELLKYEQWCKDNNIELDKDKIYHDANGNLFTHYFDKD